MRCRVRILWEIRPPLPACLSQSDTDYALSHNLTPFIAMQNHYNLVYREEEREMMPTLKVRFVIRLSYSSISDLQVFCTILSTLESVPSRGVHSPEEP